MLQLPWVVWVVAKIALLAAFAYILWGVLGLCFHEVLPIGPAAERLWTYWQEHPEKHARKYGLPKKLQGVWWMKGNPAPEVCVTFDGNRYDAATRTLLHGSMWPYNWTLNTGLDAFLLMLFLRPLTVIKFEFNEDHTFAKMPFLLFGIIPISCVTDFFYSFDMKQVDAVGHTWKRTTYVLGSETCCGVPWVYDLVKVIDWDGTRLPAFGEMVEFVESGGQTYCWSKTRLQAIPKRLPCLRWLDGPEVPLTSNLEDQRAPLRM